MVRSIIFREWIKLKTVLLITLGAEICYAIYSCMELKYFIRNINPVKVIGVIGDNNYIFFHSLQTHFAIMGVIIALLQFLPEMKNKTLKLTLHLPYNNIKMLRNMLTIGVSVLLATSLFLLILFLSITSYYFPKEVVYAYLYSLLPWIASGLFSYLICSAFCIEQRWSLRFLMMFVLYFIVDTFILENAFFAYKSSILWFIACGLVSMFVPYYSLKRFKEGK